MSTFEEGEREGDRIRSLFAAMGGAAPLRDIARRCIEATIWDETQLESMMLHGAIKRVKDALRRELNGSGLPFAAAVDKGLHATWKQRDLFSFEDYTSIIDMGIAALGADHAKLRAWQEECRRRFGTSPSIPDLVA